jgi:hypothetical protein
LLSFGSGFRVQGSRFKVQGSRFKVQGSRFRVQGSGLRWRLRRLFLEDGILALSEQIHAYVEKE